MHLMGKEKPKEFVYVLEYPNGDSVSRRMIRNRLKKKLAVSLAGFGSDKVKLIEKVDVVSINEWNQNEEYGMFPIKLKSGKIIKIAPGWNVRGFFAFFQTHPFVI